MIDTKRLEADFKERKKKIQDLERRDGNEKEVQELKERLQRTGQTLNMFNRWIRVKLCASFI